MDAFSPIPNHTGFTARSLFTDAQGTLKDGAFANMEPGGGGPLSRTATPTPIYSSSPAERSSSCLTKRKKRSVSMNPCSCPAASVMPSGTGARNRRKS